MRLTSPSAVVLMIVVAACAPRATDSPPRRVPSAEGRGPDVTASPAPDLYSLELVPTARAERAWGTVRMERPQTPMGAAVTAEGTHVHELVAEITGLPEPASLGAYGTYVAWLTTPILEPVVKLGEVTNGRARIGRAAFDKFLVLVSAEPHAGVAERTGPLVLRGMSPSTRMEPHLSTRLPPQDDGGHAHHDGAASGWPMPPMHPGVAYMVPGLERLVPSDAPWRPSADAASVPAERPREVLDLADGDTLTLVAAPVRRRIGNRDVVVYGFNGQSPGPFLRVRERATVTVLFENRLELPSAVHWHGVRLDNRFDGVPGMTQDPVPPGGRFTYELRFPDPGIYWYHPHLREDIQQELGLYGNILVRGGTTDAWGAADREEAIILDDLLLADDGAPFPFGRTRTTHALMGRFGNVFLANGSPDLRLDARVGEVVRLYLTNASSTRVLNVSIPGARLKLVGGDIGPLEREEWVESVVLAPAERWVVETRLDSAGSYAMVNAVRAIDHTAGRFFGEVDTLLRVDVGPRRSAGCPPEAGGCARRGAEFDSLDVRSSVTAEVGPLRGWMDRAPDKELLLTLRTKTLPFGLVQALRLDTGFVNPVEWSGTMPMMDWLPTPAEVEWVLREPATGRENMAIDWRFARGELVKVRLRNDRHTLHPMSHPIHLHGQRFLVLARNGVAQQNLGWKDTVLLPVGETADLLVEMSNPGRWMMHCHIAEHLEAGMHLGFVVGHGSM
ncbi:MAG TPA: multicopper oxidase family protein [Gemmatimonadaceae bacterium]